MTVDEMESAASDLLSSGSHDFLSTIADDPTALYSDEEPIRTSHEEEAELADEMACVTSLWLSTNQREEAGLNPSKDDWSKEWGLRILT